MRGHSAVGAGLGHVCLPATHRRGRNAHDPCSQALPAAVSLAVALSWTEEILDATTKKKTTAQARQPRQLLATHRR